MIKKEPWYEKCEDCACNTFKIKVYPFGECGTDHMFICTKCGESIGGVISDPLDEYEDGCL